MAIYFIDDVRAYFNFLQNKTSNHVHIRCLIMFSTKCKYYSLQSKKMKIAIIFSMKNVDNYHFGQIKMTNVIITTMLGQNEADNLL